MHPKETDISRRKNSNSLVNGATLPNLKQIKNTAI